MSETRIVIEDPDLACLHGNWFGRCRSYIGPEARIRCPGGRRRVLTRVDGHWPDWLTDLHPEAHQFLDALAKSEQEGTE